VHLLFGDFVFDPERQLLRKNGALLKVDPQQLSLLSCLATRPGHLLTREDILKQVGGPLRNQQRAQRCGGKATQSARW
jgi:DNA-binding winged helix-turn-helix (wHTH) protein